MDLKAETARSADFRKSIDSGNFREAQPRSQSSHYTTRTIGVSGTLWRSSSRHLVPEKKKGKRGLVNTARREFTSEPQHQEEKKFTGELFKDRLKLMPFGQEWFYDILSLPHNAIRSELRDLVVMEKAISKMKGTPLSRDVATHFEEWWTNFARFCVEFMAFEDSVMARHLQAVLPREEYQRGEEILYPYKKEALESIQRMDAVIAQTKASLEVQNSLKNAAERVQFTLTDYFEQKEILLPPILEFHFPQHIGERIQRKLVDYFCEGPLGKMALVMLTYWLRNRRSLFQQWCIDVLPLALRVAYPHWKRKFETNHKMLVFKVERATSRTGSRG